MTGDEQEGQTAERRADDAGDHGKAPSSSPSPAAAAGVRRPTPPPYPSERARSLRRSTQPETPISRFSSSPPAEPPDASEAALKAPAPPAIPAEYRAHLGSEPNPRASLADDWDHDDVTPIEPTRSLPADPITAEARSGSGPAASAAEGDVDVDVDADWAPSSRRTPAPPAAAEQPAAAIQVMRIIAIGVSKPVEEPIPVTEDVEITEQFSEPAVSGDGSLASDGLDVPVDSDPLMEALLDRDVPVETEEPTPAPTRTSDVEELSEDDMAPDSVPPPPVKADAKPPPPPRRQFVPAPTPESEKERILLEERARQRAAEEAKRARRPWWELLFTEDFMRASSRMTDAQIYREVDFIQEALGVAPSGVVLDLACGAGNHAVELAERGFAVVGYDLSLYQLALAADVAQERGQKLNLLQGDMREMAFEEMFDGIYCWNTSFGYFEEDKNLNVAQRIFNALRPGGTFLLDVANRDFVAANQPSSVWYEGDSCVCMDDMQMDFITSRVRVKRSIILDDGRTRECLYSIRLYTLHELGKLLHEVGFNVVEVSGHVATPGVFFGQHSPRIIMVAQRP